MSVSKDRIKRKSESESITFRLEKSVLDELRQEANQKMESINTLVNQIIKSYMQWHKPAKKAGLGYFSKVLISGLLDSLTDEQIDQITQEFCKNNLLDINQMLRSESNIESFMDSLCSWLEASGYHYRFDNFDDFNVYVIQFDMGRKWSLYFKTQMRFVFDYYNTKNAEVDMTNNTVVLKIKK
jgi:hypothetical protein